MVLKNLKIKFFHFFYLNKFNQFFILFFIKNGKKLLALKHLLLTFQILKKNFKIYNPFKILLICLFKLQIKFGTRKNWCRSGVYQSINFKLSLLQRIKYSIRLLLLSIKLNKNLINFSLKLAIEINNVLKNKGNAIFLKKKLLKEIKINQQNLINN